MSDADSNFDDVPEPAGFRARLWRLLKAAARPIAIAILPLLLLWYGGGALWISTIDDDLDFVVPSTDMPEHGSRAVAMSAALIDREINQHAWVANDPFFLPGAILDNMPNFQEGIIGALARFSFELTDQIGRSRGSSRADTDLQEAAGLLQYSGTKWIFDISTSWAPTASSEAQYGKARRALISYNRRVADGKAAYEQRADNLLSTLDRIAADLGSSTAVLDREIADHAGDWVDFKADDLFYSVKGQTYAYYLLLRELGKDFETVIRDRDVTKPWQQMLESLHHAASLRPVMVINAKPDAWIRPSHLAAQGFYLLRARTQLREISNILQK